MIPFVWITDPHLNHCDAAVVQEFLANLRAAEPTALWITGDFSESTQLLGFLQAFADECPCPIYFVLGNHDFYFGSIIRIREEVTAFCRTHEHLHYMTGATAVEIGSGIALIGDDGWADARIGDYERSMVMLHDYTLIDELKGVSKLDRWTLLKQFGDAAAERVRVALREALTWAEHVVFLTHVPPMREACWHEGRISDDEWAPHFTCKAIGGVIMETMLEFPTQKLTVLCGHTHGGGQYQPASNIIVYTGPAEYGHPSITGIFDDRAMRIE